MALEVVVTTPAINKLEVYRGLGVREVWIFRENAFELFTLRRPMRTDIHQRPAFVRVPEGDNRPLFEGNILTWFD